MNAVNRNDKTSAWICSKWIGLHVRTCSIECVIWPPYLVAGRLLKIAPQCNHRLSRPISRQALNDPRHFVSVCRLWHRINVYIYACAGNWRSRMFMVTGVETKTKHICINTEILRLASGGLSASKTKAFSYYISTYLSLWFHRFVSFRVFFHCRCFVASQRLKDWEMIDKVMVNISLISIFRRVVHSFIRRIRTFGICFNVSKQQQASQPNRQSH